MSTQKYISEPYIKGKNYFKLFCDFEKKFSNHEYDKYTPEEVWGHGDRPLDHRFFYECHITNMYKFTKMTDLKDEMKMYQDLNKKSTDDFLWAFITIGWNEQTITPGKMLSASLKVQKLKYFTYCDFVLEKHRENGIHHHTHFLVKFSEKFPPSKIIGWIFNTNGVKEICRELNFIDYLGPQKPKKHYEDFKVYYDYVRGAKKAAKMPFVDQDANWRLSNEIEDLYVREQV
jgi:hypothetical protein